MELDHANQERRRLEDDSRDLHNRLDVMKEEQRQLEINQKNNSIQLEEFVHENERIRQQIRERDRVAQNLKERARARILESEAKVHDANSKSRSPPRRMR